jgi:hypothetical protein
MLATRGLPPKTPHVEITEELLMADRERARNILNRLREGGVQISICMRRPSVRWPRAVADHQLPFSKRTSSQRQPELRTSANTHP